MVLYEDGYETPLWLEFQRTFIAKSKKHLPATLKEIERFEKSHPHLRLVDIEENTRTNKVLGEPLFRDHATLYREIKFEYTSYIFTNYYKPDPLLPDYLQELQYFIVKRRIRRITKPFLVILFLMFLKKHGFTSVNQLIDLFISKR